MKQNHQSRIMTLTSTSLILQDELEYDPMLYRSDREKVDCDFDSVNETSSATHSQREDSQITRNVSHEEPVVRWEPGHEPQHPIIPGKSVYQYVEVPSKPANAQHDRIHSVASPFLSHEHRSSYHNTRGHDSSSASRFHGAHGQPPIQPPIQSDRRHNNYRQGGHTGVHGTQTDGYNLKVDPSREEHTTSMHNSEHWSPEHIHRGQDAGQQVLRMYQPPRGYSSRHYMYRPPDSQLWGSALLFVPLGGFFLDFLNASENAPAH